jgi:F0F1-type ATP synthase membrane subunit a
MFALRPVLARKPLECQQFRGVQSVNHGKQETFCRQCQRYQDGAVRSIHNEFKTLLGDKIKGRTFIFISLFSLILFNYFLGLFPFIFTRTRHSTITLTLALPLWVRYSVRYSVVVEILYCDVRQKYVCCCLRHLFLLRVIGFPMVVTQYSKVICVGVRHPSGTRDQFFPFSL